MINLLKEGVVALYDSTLYGKDGLVTNDNRSFPLDHPRVFYDECLEDYFVISQNCWWDVKRKKVVQYIPGFYYVQALITEKDVGLHFTETLDEKENKLVESVYIPTNIKKDEYTLLHAYVSNLGYNNPAHSNFRFPNKIGEYPSGYIDKVQKATSKHTSQDVKQLNPELCHVLKDIKFGIELEVANVRKIAPTYAQTGFVRLSDGSLPSEGGEFASIPLEGIQGLLCVEKFVNNIEKATLSTRCATHIHISSVALDEKSIVAAYFLYYRMQETVMDILPYFVRDPLGTSAKRMNYANPLQSFGIGRNVATPSKVKEWYNTLKYYFTAQQTEDAEVNPVWGSSWNSPSRYCAVNLLNIFEKGKPNTIEFRIFPPTLNSEELLLYLFICIATVKFATQNPDTILSSFMDRRKISVEDVLIEIAPQYLHESILACLDQLRERQNQRYLDALHENGSVVNNQGRLSLLKTRANEDLNTKIKLPVEWIRYPTKNQPTIVVG